jgi:hypothetical protein
MSLSKYDITILQGSDFALELQLKDAVADPINISGATILSQIRTSWDAPVIATLTPTITDGPNGRFNIYLSGAASQAINPPITARYDILVTLTSGVRMRVLEGNCIVDLAISHV